MLPLLALLAVGTAAAMSVLPLNLEELTARADTIFVGHVTRVDPGTDEQGIAAIWTTFAIDQSLKGAPGPSLTLKQLATPFRGGPFPSTPRFVPGESVVLFVHAASALGFASPVGLGQGTFRIRERDGERVVENQLANGTIEVGITTAGRTMSGPSPGPLPLDALLARVRALVASTP